METHKSLKPSSCSDDASLVAAPRATHMHGLSPAQIAEITDLLGSSSLRNLNPGAQGLVLEDRGIAAGASDRDDRLG